VDGLGAAQAPYVWLAAGNSKEPKPAGRRERLGGDAWPCGHQDSGH